MNSDEIAEAEATFGLRAIAEMTVELYRVRAERKRLEKIEESFKTALREHITRTGEPIIVEGIPALRLVPVTQPWYETSGLSGREWAALIETNRAMIMDGEEPFLRVHDASYKKAQARGLSVKITKTRGKRTDQLRFDEEDAGPMATAARRIRGTSKIRRSTDS